MSAQGSHDLLERFNDFFRSYYREEVGELAQRYPREQRTLEVDYTDLFTFDRDLAEDWIAKPDQMQEYAEEALRQYDLPVDVSLSRAHVRMLDLNSEETFYPGEYRPREDAGSYLAIEGQVHKTSEVYATMEEAAFECDRCGTMSYVPQDGHGDGFQEPHECQGCERQGPFSVNFDQSEFVDAQKLRIEEPPERAANGSGEHIDVFVEDDIVDTVGPGDKVVASGILHLEQEGSKQTKKNKFTPYLEGQALTTKDTEFEEISLSDDDRDASDALVDGTSPAYDRLTEETDPGVYERITDDDRRNIYDLGIASLAPSIYGYEVRKLSYILQLVGGVRVDSEGGVSKRGNYHVLNIGDPSTAKSQMLDEVAQISPRSVVASGRGASKAGMTAAAVQDDFSDTGEWSLEGGALVAAHKGVAAIDELDKVSPDVAESMHRAMAQQEVSVNKAGINATLPTETAVNAAANPTGGRWDDYTPTHEQIDLPPTLMSRFGLIWKFVDEHDETKDRNIAYHTDDVAETAKRIQRGEDVDEEDRRRAEPAIEHDLLRKHIARAKREVKKPVYASDDVQERLVESYITLRGINGRDDDVAIPVTPRKLDDIKRIAEAAAKFELSETIEFHHVEIAQFLIGRSMRQFGQDDESGEFDADVVEAGTTRTQEDRKKTLIELVKDLQGNSGGVREGELLEAAEEDGVDRQRAKDELTNLVDIGELYQPGGEGTYRRWS